MSQRAPGYRFQYQVPPTSSAASKACAENPDWRRRWSRYSPANPAPTTTTSTCAGTTLDPLLADTIRPPPFAPRSPRRDTPCTGYRAKRVGCRVHPCHKGVNDEPGDGWRRACAPDRCRSMDRGAAALAREPAEPGRALERGTAA